MKIKNKILCLLLLLLLLMISLLVFVNKKESINALVLYRSSIDELAPLSSDITENTNIKINYILITIGICFIMFVLGELVKPIYTKLFKDYREVKNEK